MTEAGYAGGAPILGEGLALDLMNTFYAARGKPAEGIRSAEDATAWVQRLAERLAAAGAPSAAEASLDGDHLSTLIGLRKAMRGIGGALVAGAAPDEQDLAAVNHAAALSPRWAAMSWDRGPAQATQTNGAPVDQVLSTLAHDAIDLLAGSDAIRLRLCERPGCPLFFLKDHPRREWCTPACGARVRAARAYDKRVRRQRIGSPS